MNLDNDMYKQRANAMLFHINVGTDIICTIRKLVETVAKVISYQGDIILPDGTPKKLMDPTPLA